MSAGPDGSIDDETARKLGRDLTEQHPVTVYGMAKSCVAVKPGFAITSCRVKAVRNHGCDVYVTTCRGDLCEMNHALYEFRPPRQSAEDLPSRIPQIHNSVCTPNPLWLITDPLALVALTACSGVAYGTYIGIDAMVDAIAGAPRLETGIVAIFGSARMFGRCVVGGNIFAIVAHGIEAVIVVRQSFGTLKLDVGPTMLWGLLVMLVGYPIFTRFQDLMMSGDGSQLGHGDAKSK